MKNTLSKLLHLVFLVLFSISCHSAQKTTILIVGDSLSAGYGFPPEQSWVNLLNQQMEQTGKNIVLINDSITGDTTAGGLARLKDSLEIHEPEWVVIQLGGNDGLRGMSLKALRANLTQMVTIAREHGVSPFLMGVELPPNYGRTFIAAFNGVYATVAKETDTPLLANVMAGAGLIPDLMQDDGIHPNAKAQPVIRDHVWAFFEPYLK